MLAEGSLLSLVVQELFEQIQGKGSAGKVEVVPVTAFSSGHSMVRTFFSMTEYDRPFSDRF